MLTVADGSFNELLALGFLELDAAGVGLAGRSRASRPATSRRSGTCSDRSTAARGRRPTSLAARTDRYYTLVLLRHGESDWNAKNLFTGWVDVPLSDKGRAEAEAGGRLLAEAGRAAGRRAHLAAAPGDHHREPRARRRRPALDPGASGAGGSTSGTTARCRARTRSRRWRSTARSSSCSGAAPTTSRRRRSRTDDEFSQAGDPRYADLGADMPAHRVPEGRRRADAARTGTRRSCPTCGPARTVLVAAHGNSLRALVKHLDGISDADIAGAEHPDRHPAGLPARRRPAPDRARRHVPRPAGRRRGGRRRGQPGPLTAAPTAGPAGSQRTDLARAPCSRAARGRSPVTRKTTRRATDTAWSANRS